MKKTDQLIKKAQKRYTMPQLFFRKIIQSVIAVFTVSFLIITIMLTSAVNEMGTSTGNLTMIVQKNINSAYEKKENVDNNVRYNLCSLILNIRSDSFAVIYDTDTGQIVYRSDKDVFAMLSINDKTKIYRCADEALDRVMKSIEKYTEEDSFNTVSFRLKSAYVKDNRFIPASIDAVNINSKGRETTENITYDAISTDGYEYYEFDKKSFIMVTGTSFDDNLTELMTQEVARAYRQPGRNIHQENTLNIFGKNVLYDRALIKANDKNYEMLYYSTYNFFRENISGLCIEICIGLAVSAVIAWLLASKKYSELSAHYALEDYRRELTNTLAHDLKSPLTVISGCAENIRCGSKPEKNTHYSDSILENVNYMDSLISDVLELSKLENSTVIMNKTKVKPEELTDEIIKKYETVISEKNIRIKVSGNGTINADRNMISHAFENLLTNAIKYSDNSATILISISDESYTIINDCNIPAQTDADNLCRPFIKGDRSRSGKKGSGLGLTIVKNITEAHGYFLTLHSENGQFTAKINFNNKDYKIKNLQ